MEQSLEILNGIQSNEITYNIINYLSRIFWSGMCSFLLAYNKGSCNILSHATFQSIRDRFLVKSASHAPASITIWWRKWSRMTWMGFFDFSLHSFTADDSLKLNLLSMSRLAKTSTFSKGKRHIYSSRIIISFDLKLIIHCFCIHVYHFHLWI